MNHLTCKTICLTAGMTILLLAGPVQTASAREQTTFGFYIGVRDYDSYRHYDDRNHYRRAYPRRYYNGPRYRYPSYYRPGYYDRRYDYPYRRDYYRRHDDSDRFIATATGVFFGVLIGSELIRYMNDVDRLRAREANMVAMSGPIGSRITWNNPQTYNYGSVTATRDGYSDSGKYCREFYQTVSIGGRAQDAYGVACLQPDGDWRIVQ